MMPSASLLLNTYDGSDSERIQQAVDAAAAGNGRVIIPRRNTSSRTPRQDQWLLDQVIALTAIPDAARRDGNLNSTMISADRQCARPGIHNIILRNIRGHCAGGHHIVRHPPRASEMIPALGAPGPSASLLPTPNPYIEFDGRKFVP